MPCEHYKDALIEVAASNAEPPGELRSHLSECASCRTAFAEQQSLLAAVHSELHRLVNAEVPPSFLPRVHARLEEATALRLPWLEPLVFAAAGVALALVVFLTVRPHRAKPESAARVGPMVAPVPATTRTNAIPPRDSQIAAIPLNHSRTAPHSAKLHSAAPSNPEVVVPPDEREAFARLVAVLNERSEVAASLLAKVPEKKDKDGLATVGPLKIPDIEIKPLEGTEAEASDGALESISEWSGKNRISAEEK